MARRYVTLRRSGSGAVCQRCLLAATPWLRLRGLLGRSEPAPGEGILIRPTSSIHMMFMRYPIDAVFLDRDLRILKVVENLRPWRFASRRGAKQVLEVRAGSAAELGLRTGEVLELSDTASRSPEGR
jgi:uncharacterized membrane protein (UPF0127 family)